MDFTTPFELLIATILSAQCTDARVNIVTKTLFVKYRSPQDVLAVTEEELQKDIFSCGHYRMKAKHIRETCLLLVDRFGGRVPDAMDELLTLPGVGRKTATVVLYAAFGKSEGIAVDTHVWRVSKRLGLTQSNAQDKLEQDLMRQTPRKDWGLLHTLLICHGRAVCVSRNRKCDLCVFREECPSSRTKKRLDLSGRNGK